LWAALQVKQILKCKILESVDHTLKTLPKDLSEAYDGVAPEAEMANRTFRWIMSAPDPLTSEELLSAVRINIDNDEINLVNPNEQDTLLSICENFLIVDSNGQWRFFHLSVLEYLQRMPEFNQQEHFYCAQVCLLCLMRTFADAESTFLLNKMNPAPSSGDFVDPLNAANGFSRHIQRNWPYYASKLTKNDSAFLTLQSFLGSTNKSSRFFIRWSSHLFEKENLVSFRSLKIRRLWENDLASFATPIFAIMHFSLYKIFSQYCEDSDFEPLQSNENEAGLFEIAASADCVPILRILVSKFASIDHSLFDKAHGAAIGVAARFQSSNALRYLVSEVSAHVNLLPRVEGYDSALAAVCCSSENLGIVRYILGQGVDVNLVLQVGDYGSALAAACSDPDNLDTVTYLVDQGADVNLPLEVGYYGSALAATCLNAHNLDIVRYLVEQGADAD
jgi:hypothetical protein